MEKRERKALVVVSTVSLVGIIGLSIGFSLSQSELNEKNRIIQNGYERSFYLLCDSVNNLENDLAKLSVSSANGESMQIIQDAHTHANGALDGYSGLDVDLENGITTFEFFNQVSDWSNSYARATAINNGESYKDQAYSLYERAKQINDKLKEISTQNNGYEIARNVDFLRQESANGENAKSMEYPSLIYDGPFSDGEKFVSTMLENKKEISKEEAKNVATTLLGMQNAKVVGSADDNVYVYEIEGDVNGVNAYASITKKGGYVYNFITNSNDDGGSLSADECGKIGKVFLKKLGYDYMEPVWYNEIDSDVYVNFAPKVDNVTYYTDLVKMRINSNGEVEAIEAKGYVSSYKVRDYTPKLSEREALAKADGLNVKSVCLAVIPQINGEAFCYEIYGEKYGLDYYLYFDAQNGIQREILRVVNSNQGRKSM